MIETVWPYLAMMLLCAGLFGTLERLTGNRLFSILPPIVLTYLLVTALATAGLWQLSNEIRTVQSAIVSRLMPAVLFLLMVDCDLRAIWRLGARVLAVFVCATASLVMAFPLAFLIFRSALPADAWQPLAALSGSWMGGSANMVAVKQAIGMPDSLLAMSLLTDALCYSVWVGVLFSLARFAPTFNRWTGATGLPQTVPIEPAATDTVTADAILLWLGAALLVATASAWVGGRLPVWAMITPTTWSILVSTAAGLVVAQTRLSRFPGAAPLSGALLIGVVAILGSQSDFHGFADAPLYVACGFTILAIHAIVLTLAARAFHFDLFLCAIASLAHIGGVATTPILAATYSRSLVPVGVLLALLGYVLGTGVGIMIATVLARLAGGQ